MKRFIKILIPIVIVIAVAIMWLSLSVFPAISGYGSKNLCSAVYLQHRDASDVIREELSDFPLSLGTFTLNEADSSVTGSVWGLAKRKTIYRGRLGCTLINDFSEEEIRSQKFSLPDPIEVYTDTIPWPAGDKIIVPIPAEIDQNKLKLALTNVMDETDAEGNPRYTKAVVIVYDGEIIAERYADGFDKNTVMLGWSVSKSLMGALVGILDKEKRLSAVDPAPIPEWKGTDKESITVEQLLQQTSGIDFVENYDRPSNVTQMLFSEGDMAAYVASLPLAEIPGTQFSYSSGNSNLISRIIRNTVGEEDYASFPYTALFHRINAYSFLIEPDASGTYIGSSYSYATTRDFARFGLLYYNKGKWGDTQVLTPEWIEASTRPSEADGRKHYGYQFWLNGYKEGATERWYPDVPEDMFFADGFNGQDIYIIPSKKLVVVRLGLRTIDENKFLKEVIASVENPSASP